MYKALLAQDEDIDRRDMVLIRKRQYLAVNTHNLAQRRNLALRLGRTDQRVGARERIRISRCVFAIVAK